MAWVGIGIQKKYSTANTGGLEPKEGPRVSYDISTYLYGIDSRDVHEVVEWPGAGAGICGVPVEYT